MASGQPYISVGDGTFTIKKYVDSEIIIHEGVPEYSQLLTDVIPVHVEKEKLMLKSNPTNAVPGYESFLSDIIRALRQEDTL